MASSTVTRAVFEIAAETAQYFTELAKVKGGALDLTKTFATASAQITRDMTAVGASMDILARRVGAVAAMAADFSGATIARDADEIAAAVGRVGGASKLTAAEQSRVNATVTEAINKYRQLGQEAPAHLVALQEATKGVGTNTKTLSTSMLAIGTAIGSFGSNLAMSALSKVGSALGDLVAKGTQLPALQSSFERLAAGIGQNADAMLDAVRTGTRGMVADLDIYQSANKAMLLGLPVTAESMGELAKAAQTLGKAMGQDATKSLDDLITALGRSSPMILDNLGLTVKVGEANDQYAKSLGKTADQLTDAEKKIAFYQAAMEAAKAKTDELGDQTLTLGEIVERIWTKIANVVTQTAADINVGLGRAFSSMKGFAQFLDDVRALGLQGAITVGAARTRADQDAQASAAKVTTLLDSQQARIRELVAAHHELGEIVAVIGTANAASIAAYIKSLQTATTATESGTAALAKAQAQAKSLTAEQVANIEAWTTLGKSTTEVATAMGVSSAVVEIVKTNLHDQATASEHAAAAAKQHADAAEAVAKSLQFVTDATYHQIVALNARNVSEKDIATSLRIHEVQVKQVLEAEKLLGENTRLWADARAKGLVADQQIMDAAIKRADQVAAGVIGNLKITSDAQIAADALRLKSTNDTTAQQIAAAERARDAQLAAIDYTKGNAIAAAEAVDEAYALTYDAIIADSRRAAVQLQTHNAMIAKSGGDVSAMLGALSTQFATLAQIGGDSFGGVAKAIGQGTGALDMAVKGQATYSKAMFEMGSANVSGLKSFTGLATGVMGIASAIMTGVSALTSWIKGMTAGRKAVEDFAKTKGGFDALHVQLATLGAEGERLWITLTQGTGQGNPAQAKAAIDAITTALDNQAAATAKLNADASALIPTWESAGELANKYGIELSALGDKYKQGQATAAAESIYQDWQRLSTFIGDEFNDGVLKGMSDEISGLIQQTAEFGGTIPLQLKPMIDRMKEMGLLVDENGNALEGLENIKFAETMQDATVELIKTMKELAGVIRTSVGGALADVANQASQIRPPGAGSSAPGTAAPNGTPYASASTFDGGGAPTVAGGAAAGYASPASYGAGAGANITVVSTLDGREVARNQVRYIPGELKAGGL
jgi:hypothetical protein